MNKPLGRKSYGSIPHLLGSKMGVGDKRITQGQHDYICNKYRKGDEIIVQEKLDGSCVSIAKHNGIIMSLTRSGYLASESEFAQHHMFDEWVRFRKIYFNKILKEGERVVGEWLAQAHGTHVKLVHDPFVAFDIVSGFQRVPYDEFQSRINGKIVTPHVFHKGKNFSEEQILKVISGTSFHGHEKIEGVICRLETNGKFNYIAKYVRHDYQAGIYMKEEIFNK